MIKTARRKRDCSIKYDFDLLMTNLIDDNDYLCISISLDNSRLN